MDRGDLSCWRIPIARSLTGNNPDNNSGGPLMWGRNTLTSGSISPKWQPTAIDQQPVARFGQKWHQHLETGNASARTVPRHHGVLLKVFALDNNRCPLVLFIKIFEQV